MYALRLLLTASLQLNQRIGSYLYDDADIAHFSQVCHATWNAVNADGYSFFRVKFRERYDMPPNLTNKEVATSYMRRAQKLRKGVHFKFGSANRDQETKILNVIKAMILGECCVRY